MCGPYQHPDSNPCLCVVFLHNVRPPLELIIAGIGLYPKEVEVLGEDPHLILELARVDGRPGGYCAHPHVHRENKGQGPKGKGTTYVACHGISVFFPLCYV